MKIGVSGASGNLGRGVLRELATRNEGHEIVAISRTPGPDGRVGDYDRPETLAAAYAGLDRLLLIPSSEMQPGRRGAQNVTAIDAAVSAGVKHIVFMSTAGLRQQEEPGMFASYWVAEQRLIKTAPAWSILRMNYYAESLAQEAQMSAGQGVLAGIAENRVAFVSRDDVAAAAAGLLLGDGHVGAIYNATGPTAVTGAERAATIAEVTGQPMGFVTMPAEALRSGMLQGGVPEFIAAAVISIQTEFARGTFDIVTGDVEILSGRPPKPLAEALKVALA